MTLLTRFAGTTISASYCDACLAREDAITEAPAVDIGSALAGIGINVRRHGSLNIWDLDDATAHAADEFVTRTIEADPLDAIDGLYLHGPTGTGKTQALASIARALIRSGYPEKRIVFDRARAFITTVQDRYSGGSVDEVIDRRRNAGVWLLDDVGTEKLTPDAFRIIEDILDHRDGHPMVWTSNLTPDELVAAWAGVTHTDRFRSRLATFRFLEVAGSDRRFSRGVA